LLSPRLKEGIEGGFEGKEEAFGVVGEEGFLTVGGGGGGMAFLSLSTSFCFEIWTGNSLVDSERVSVGPVVVIRGVSSVFEGGASCFDLASARGGEWWRNHARSDHGGCL
jgi:hypothetical protein